MPKSVVQKLSILVPMYNEARTIKPLLEAVLAAPLPCEREVVVVDDGSTDGSGAIVTELAAACPEIRLFTHESNRGKGGAIRTAIECMTGDWAVVQDADLEYDPNEYERLLEPVLDGVADAVFGSRFMAGRYRRVLLFWHTVANRFLTLVCNMLADLNITDMETGYKLIRGEILRTLNLTANGFDIEPELTMKLARWGARIYEVPISYRGRTYEEGKKIGPVDAAKALLAMFRYRFLERRYCKHDGYMILQAMSRAKRFNRWLFSRFQEYLGDEVLEIGCGIGNLTRLLLDRKRLVCVDSEAFYVRRLNESYGHLSNFSAAIADVTDLTTLRQADGGRPLESAVCLNVLEHIEDDVLALRNIHEALAQGGCAVILVPNNPGMYTPIDEALGHFRRYAAAELTSKMEQVGFEVIVCKPFNRFGGLLWRISGSLLRRRTIKPGQMRLFELLMPLARLMEHVPVHAHNSLVCVGRRVDCRE